MRTSEFLLAARLDAPALAAWVEAGWLLPRQEEDTADFSDVDLARARLIHDLQQDMGVNEEAIPIVLDLLDQVHGLRQMLRDLAAAVLRSRNLPADRCRDPRLRIRAGGRPLSRRRQLVGCK
jgi:chaperone modulatory protein CbpM